MTATDSVSYTSDASQPAAYDPSQSSISEKYARQTTVDDYRSAMSEESQRVFLQAAKGLPEVKLTGIQLDRTVDALKKLLSPSTFSRLITPVNDSDIRDSVYALLKDKSAAERKQISDAFQKKYDKSLEDAFKGVFDGHVLDGALGLLHRSDKSAGDAERLHTTLIERSQLFAGRSDRTCESDLIDTISTLNSKQLSDLSREYRQKYGKNLQDELLNEGTLSKETRQALTTFLKGNDRLTSADRNELASLAMKSGNLALFQKVFRDAPEAYRKEFQRTNSESKIKEAFGSEGQHALDYISKGKISVATEISENTAWTGDDEAAIEKSLANMTDQERSRYKRGQELAKNGESASSRLSDKDSEALSYFSSIDKALKRAGNSTELLRWQDMIENKGGSLVSKLAEHRTWLTLFNDDKTGKVLDTIENMSKADWTQLKSQPEHRQKVIETFKSYLSAGAAKRAEEVLDRKLSKQTFDESQKSRRMLADIIRDNTGRFDHIGRRLDYDPRKIIESISTMPELEQRNYRENSTYRKKVDGLIDSCLNSGTDKQLATSLLAKVARGESPSMNIIDKVNMHKISGADESVVVRDLKEKLTADPQLMARLREGLNGKGSEADKQFARSFANAVRSATSSSTFDEIICPLIKTGKLDVEKQIALSDHTFSTDRKGIYTDLLRLPDADRQRLLTDSAYQKKVLAALSDGERQLALNIVMQREMRPEDKLRAAILASEDKEVKELVGNLSPDEKMSLRLNYANKYGELSLDIADSLAGRDKVSALQSVRREGTTRQEFNNARDDYYRSRDGLISRLVNQTDGTGYSADSAMNQYAGVMSHVSRKFEHLPPEEQAKMKEKLSLALDKFVQSKGEVTEFLVDSAIGCAALGGSLAALAAAATVSAALKPAGKALLLGDDYANRGRDIFNDVLAGAALGALNWGASHIARAIGQAVSETCRSAFSGSYKGLLKDGAQDAFEAETQKILQTALKNNQGKIPEAAILDALKQHAKDPLNESALKQAANRFTKQLDSKLLTTAEQLAESARKNAKLDLPREKSPQQFAMRESEPKPIAGKPEVGVAKDPSASMRAGSEVVEKAAPEKLEVKEMFFPDGINFVETTNGQPTRIFFGKGKVADLRNGRWTDYQMGEKLTKQTRVNGRYFIDPEGRIVREADGMRQVVSGSVRDKANVKLVKESGAAPVENNSAAQNLRHGRAAQVADQSIEFPNKDLLKLAKSEVEAFGYELVKTREFVANRANGELRTLYFADGNRYVKMGKSWQQIDPQGNRSTFRGEIELLPDNKIIKKPLTK